MPEDMHIDCELSDEATRIMLDDYINGNDSITVDHYDSTGDKPTPFQSYFISTTASPGVIMTGIRMAVQSGTFRPDEGDLVRVYLSNSWGHSLYRRNSAILGWKPMMGN